MLFKQNFILPFCLIVFMSCQGQPSSSSGSGKTETPPHKISFRPPLNIPMELVANFGEIRANHWHMGLDIRTQRKENLPVYAAEDGYVSRVVVEPGGFGQAIYINHPGGYTTVYAHLNAFYDTLAAYVKNSQYAKESWAINLEFPANFFPVKKGDFIALSGNTGGSEGPHVHFEIRNTKTEKCINPLLFHFPVSDTVAPTITHLAMYDRKVSTYNQSPQLLTIKKTDLTYSVVPNLVKIGSNKISFAVGAVDRLSGTPNPNGIYSAKVLLDGQPVSQFVLDSIDYSVSRYINAQIDFPYKARGGSYLQHISPLPGAAGVSYTTFTGDGSILLTDDQIHRITIEVRDAYNNLSAIQFTVQYDAGLAKSFSNTNVKKFSPNNVNVFEEEEFELFTKETSLYDTTTIQYKHLPAVGNAISSLHTFLNNTIPSQNFFTVRIKPVATLTPEQINRVLIKNMSGTNIFVQKAKWQNGWLAAEFRQFGNFQAFIDTIPPVINAPATNLSKAAKIVFTPTDNFNSIKSFRAEVDGHWLRFTNDKGKKWVYTFDEKFPKGQHDLKVTVEDEAGNITTRVWKVQR